MDAARKKFPLIFSIVCISLAIFIACYALFALAGLVGRPVPSHYQYPIDAIEIDVNSILYQPSGQIVLDLIEPRGIAVDANGTIYVVGDRAIVQHGPAGNLLGRIDLPIEPYALAVGSEGLFYLAARDHVEIFDRSGQRLQAWPAPDSDVVLTSIAVCPQDVFVADAGNRVVYRYDRQGHLLGRIGQRDPERGVEGLIAPSPHLDLMVCSDGLLRVVNPGRHRIEAYTFDGQFRQAWGRFGLDLEGFSGCCNPVAIAQLPDGMIVTSEKGIIRVKVFTQEGRFLGAVAGPCQLGKATCKICQKPSECQTGAFDIATDPRGNVYVLDTIDRLVRIFQPREGTVRP